MATSVEPVEIASHLERELDTVIGYKILRGLGAASGPVRCEGQVLHVGGRTALAEARLLDGAGRLCAHATSSCLLTRPVAG